MNDAASTWTGLQRLLQAHGLPAGVALLVLMMVLPLWPEPAPLAAVAAFGQYLRGGAALNGFTLADIVTLASGAKGEDASGYRAEFIGLVKLAQALPGV